MISFRRRRWDFGQPSLRLIRVVAFPSKIIAARAFAANGYRASSLRDIAREAGCSLTLLDHHFGMRGGELIGRFHAVLQRYSDGVRADHRLCTLRRLDMHADRKED